MSYASADWIGRQAGFRPDKTAMVDLRTARSFTYREMHDRIDRLAGALFTDYGVRSGDRVAVLSRNDSNIFEVQFACWRLGAILVPLNWRLANAELEYILTDCSPVVAFDEAELGDTAAAVCAGTGVANRVSWGGPAAGAADYEEALASSGCKFDAPPTSFDTPLVVMYTSGTTGKPKGAIITQGMTFWNMVGLTEFFACNSESVNLAALPLFHIGGLNVFANPVFYFGGTTLVMHAFDPVEAVRLLSDPELGVTHFAGVVANWLFMSQTDGFRAADFSRVTAAAGGGSPVPLELIRTWLAKGVALQQCFGMTETSSFVSAVTKEDAPLKIGSAGLPAMHTECRLVDEDGRDVATGEIGEMWVRGPCVTPGYWANPDATASQISDGWLHTGDAARRDADGHYYIVDRWKDMYISGGENVYPAEIEDVLYELPEIAEVAVIGVPDARWAEVGKAVVVVHQSAPLTEQDVLAHCTSKLAKFKVPKSVAFVDELPRTASGKVLKRELRERFASQD